MFGFAEKIVDRIVQDGLFINYPHTSNPTPNLIKTFVVVCDNHIQSSLDLPGLDLPGPSIYRAYRASPEILV